MSENVETRGESVKLPSHGIFYSEPYHCLEQLKVRDLDWEDEDILTTESFYKNGTLYDEILKNTIVDENEFPAGRLVAVDRDTILWHLRARAFGSVYEIPFTCANKDCKHEFKAAWDLATFKSPVPPEKYKEELIATAGIVVTLPISGLKVKLTVTSIGRQREIEKNLKNKKEKTKATRDYFSTGRLISIINEAYDREGNLFKGSEDILKWLRTGYDGHPIPLVDSRYLLMEAKDISLTVDTRKDIVCPECHEVHSNVEMPMTIYFFWPNFDEMSKSVK